MEELNRLEKSIFDSAGCEFDILNNQQCREVLIEKLGLPDKRLECLAADYKIVADILEYRNKVQEESTICNGSAKDYVSIESLRIRKEWEIVQAFYDNLKIVSDMDCERCENKCDLYRAAKADLDDLYQNHNERFYSYLFDVLNDFKCGLQGGYMDLTV